MELYPFNYDKKKASSLQSRLFGHRIKSSETKYEYLIEFLQVAISPKMNKRTLRPYTCMFPVEKNGLQDTLEYYPKSRIGLKRFIFMPKSKIDGKAGVDKDAYEECIRVLTDAVDGGNIISKKNSIVIIQNLLNGFSAVNQNRSWFDQSVLPICPEVILPEGMGVKSWRKGLEFHIQSIDVDYKFDFHKYTYMCRGGEVYYLHLLNAINKYPEYKDDIENRLNEMIRSFPQFSFLCEFVQNNWDNHMLISLEEDTEQSNKTKITKELGCIPGAYECRNEYTLTELKNFLNSNTHPFDKMEILSNGIILQMLRMMYMVAASEGESNCWVIDVNCKGYESSETKKTAIAAFNHNEEIICKYLYKGLDKLKDELGINDDQKAIKDAADDSYRLFRKLGKTIGIIIPIKGPGMRFTLSEEIIKFLVLAIIPPKKMITLDEFVDLLYSHYGMIIGPSQYRLEMDKGTVKSLGDLSFLADNKKAFSQKLKDCGFLRDLSDATSIVENPYESEDDA